MGTAARETLSGGDSDYKLRLLEQRLHGKSNSNNHADLPKILRFDDDSQVQTHYIHASNWRDPISPPYLTNIHLSWIKALGQLQATDIKGNGKAYYR